MRKIRILAAVVSGVLASAALFVAPAEAAGPAPHYLMTAFTNSSESNMYVYDSANGTDYSLIRANAYTPPAGLIRDPSVMRHTDGYYYLVYTTNWTGNTIGFARSADHVTWTFLRNVTVGLNGSTGSTWAPEWFKDTDGSVHVVFSASTAGTAGQFQPYKITATSGDLSTWSARTAIGIPANHIDTFVVRSGATYHAFVKNETTKYIEHATAPALTGPWTFTGTGNWAGWGSGLEGPALVQLPSGAWRLYFDQYGAGRYYYADSSNLTTWSAKTELPGLSGTVRHFTVLRENVGDSTAVPTGNRSLRSSNFPDRYVRHRNSLGYVEVPGTATDRLDATFTIGAGLANGNCYSLQSVNPAGRYLRHNNNRLILSANDGTATFRNDATFCGRAGLSGTGTTSFESYNYPGFYLRHYNYELRIDRNDNSATLKADASFTVSAPLG
ncbi:glycoside hydrolase family 43 protein [Actinoplanes friuliensis]|uniref:Alpha l-arabinofuranosidase n=1 Tax=Actinoplanes friuliensis DSM 7358 TaxID=1246995 RepID=U5W7A5_9ACTN|nr:glycoside hydrolase family 43 protein [Actinoplanes friuliensis]AGZ43831.1 alpha l-arabinofuranosidase [Actinoplanes friuliensis DSM 7358]